MTDACFVLSTCFYGHSSGPEFLDAHCIVSPHAERVDCGTYADRKENLRPGEFSLSKSKISVPHKDIIPALSALLKEYKKGAIDMECMDFHIRSKQICPFKAYNGRVGQLIVMKECLHHGIDLIDDKRRDAYNCGIAAWGEDHEPLMSVSFEVQKHFQDKIELCALFQYARYPEPYRGGKI